MLNELGLLYVSFGQFRGDRRQVAEQSIRSIVGAGSEVQLWCRRLIGIGISRADI
jgi:hypothetical protein